MKVKGIILGTLFLFATASTFATKTTNSKALKAKKTIAKSFDATCTVSVSYGSTSISIKAGCSCSQTQACDLAYKIARLGIK